MVDLKEQVLLPAALETQRLLLRPPQVADAEQVNRSTRESFAELHAFMEWAVLPPELEDSRQFCATGTRELRTGSACPLLMFRRSDDALLGGTGFASVDLRVPKFEIGYWCVTAETGQGYVSEAVAAQCRHVFATFKARRVELRMDERNKRSERVAKRLGFTLEGTLRNDARGNDSSLRNTRVYAMTAVDQLSDGR